MQGMQDRAQLTTVIQVWDVGTGARGDLRTNFWVYLGILRKMAAPVFSKHWYDRPEKEQKTAMSKFHAAVASARSGTDEAVKQVQILLGWNSKEKSWVAIPNTFVWRVESPKK